MRLEKLLKYQTASEGPALRRSADARIVFSNQPQAENQYHAPPEWYDGALFEAQGGMLVKKGVLFAIGALAFLAGCNSQNSKYTMKLQPKWQGAPYHIAFDAPPAKPNPSGITIPNVKYTANPNMLENRACLVVRFDPPAGVGDGQTVMNQVIMGPVDVKGAAGVLDPDYMGAADQALARLLSVYKIKGKVKVSVLLARPLLSNAGASQIQENSLSDWLSTDLVYQSGRAKR